MGDAQSTEDHGFAILEVMYHGREKPIWVRTPLGVNLADGEVFTMQQLVEALDGMMEEGNESFIQLTHVPLEVNSQHVIFLRAKHIEYVSVFREDLSGNVTGK